MVQINTYSFSQSGQRITPNFSDRTRKLEFQVVGGEGGGGEAYYTTGSDAPGGKGGSVSGTYTVDLSSDDKYIRVYPGASKGGSNYFGSAGNGDGDGGAMSAIALIQDSPSGNISRTFLAAGGGGGGAADGQGGGGGGGFPGGVGKNNASDADTISFSFAQGLGGDGASSGFNSANRGNDGGAAVAGFVTNASTGTARGEAKVDVQTYGVPAPVTDLTTSINSNYYPVLSWSAANNGITQRVYRKERNESSFSQIGTVSDNTGTFTDTSAVANTAYSYKIVQDNNYYQESNTSVINTPDERIQVYRNGNWEPATLQNL
jgi:hypothetical protein